MSEPRIVCQFSCGAASAVATKLILAEYDGSRVVIVNAFIKEEHADNRRFLVDCEKWFEHPITVLRDEKYGASVREVWRRERYIKGPNGTSCAKHLKRKPLAAFSLPDDIFVLGFTAEESDRADEFRLYNPGREIITPLVERNLSHGDCLALVDRAGLVLPMRYRQGYDNANCTGCPKGGNGYWNKTKRDTPADFYAIADIQEAIGPGANFLRDRRTGERISLRQLPEDSGAKTYDEPSFSCSFFCEMTEQDLRDSL